MIENSTANEYPACGPAQAPLHRKAGAPGVLLAAMTLLAVPFVLFSAFNGISWFDDEGTLMVGFRSMLDGHRMYDEIYSLYGPLYNAIYGLIYVVAGIPLTHTAGRLIAATLWLCYTAGFAAFCYRLTRSVPAMLIGFFLVLVWLARLMDSPGHPQELCLLLLATTLLLMCSAERAPGTTALMGLGAAVAALALVKINIGAYVGGGILLVFLRATTPAAWTRNAILIVGVALVSLPLAVQALLFEFEWVRLYIVFSTLTVGAAVLVLVNEPMPSIIRPAGWLSIASAAGLTCVVVIGGTMMAGSSGHALLNAMLLQNAHFIRNWFFPLDLEYRDLAAAAASVFAAAAYSATPSRPSLQDYRRLGLQVLKFWFVVLGIFSIAFEPSRIFPILTPFCWLVMIPPAGDQRLHPIARGAAGLIGAIMSLYPFPVAGTQINIGALIPVIMIPILGCDVLTSLPQKGTPPLHARLTTLLTAAIVLSPGAFLTLRSARVYWHNVPLGLPGTSLIRVDQTQADNLRWVTSELSSCGSSYSLPGLGSFTFWTGHALLTALNINDVLAFIQPAQQEEIVQALSRQPDLCVVYNPEFLRFFDRGQIQTDPPLLHYILTDFVKISERNGYAILKRSSPPE